MLLGLAHSVVELPEPDHPFGLEPHTEPDAAVERSAREKLGLE